MSSNMKKILFSFITLIMSVQAFAQVTASFDFIVSVKGNYPFNGSGKAIVQDTRYYVKTGGIEIFCDGSARWMIDTIAQEVTVETAGNWMDMVVDYDLRYEGSQISGAVINLVDGSEVSVAVSDFKESIPSSTKFSLDVSKLPDGYIVTDLRD